MRLIPVVMSAAAGLLLIKVAHIAVNPDLDALSVTQAVAQEAEKKTPDAEMAKDKDGAKDGEATAGDKDVAGKGGEMAADAGKSGDEQGSNRKDLITNTEIEVLERLAERRKMLDKKAADLKLQEIFSRLPKNA